MSATAVRVEVLGPLRVLDADGHDITPSGVLQRRLLALLVLRRGRVVSTDAATDALWPTGRPRDPVAALQNHVARLRRLLPAGLIESDGSGYRLEPDGVEVDADLLLMVLGGDPSGTAEELRGLLRGWHGPAYAELDEIDEATIEADRLDDLRQRALELIAESRLAAGDLDGLVPDLTALTESGPLRERPRALLMAALAASGRTADALRAYDDFRRRLGDELGTEPSPQLAAQYATLLEGTDAPEQAVRSRLPAPATPLIGRQESLTRLVQQVASNRLVTIVGAGGVGKTRLLVELGGLLAADRPDRAVTWCELGQADASSAPEVVAAALGIDGRPGVPSADRIVDALGGDELILLIDNCEHVLDPAAALVRSLMVGCPGLRIVATSRERLRVPGEQLCPLAPLSTDGESSPAVELFVRRARAAAPDFAPEARIRPLIVEIVEQLDGLPLAIELAAARLNSLELDELAAGLEHRFELLSVGYRGSARHGSLSAAVSWSYDSLDPDLRRAFAALSVFARAFTEADAAAVCGSAGSSSRLLAELVERSLLQRVTGGRFSMLETLRAYGAEQLAESGRAQEVRERHARWMVEWVEEADRALAGPGRPVLGEIDDALTELRSSLLWLVEHGLVDHAGRLVAALVDYAFLRLRPDVLAWAALALGDDSGAHDGQNPRAPILLAASAYAAWMGGDLDASARLIDRALEAERSGDRQPGPRVRVVRGNVALFEGRLGEAAEWYQDAIDAAGTDKTQRVFATATLLLAWGYAGDDRAVALADELLRELGPTESAPAAYVWYCAGEAVLGVDVDCAAARLGTAIRIAEATNASFVRGVAGASKASIAARLSDPEAAMAEYRWLIEHWRRAGVWATQWTMLRSVAAVLARVGRYHDAALLEGAVRGTREGHRIFGADAVALDELGAQLRTELGDDDYEAALVAGARLDGPAAADWALQHL